MTGAAPDRHVCVFAGSSSGARDAYTEAATRLGHELVSRGLGLVYGGARVGLMGTLADAVLARGGHVVGVIPEALVSKEVAHDGLADLRVVDSMHARKALMAELASGFVALPGGVGTLEELFEILTWAQLGMHRHPCGLLNVAGYYDRLAGFLDHCVEQRFLKPKHRELLIMESDAKSLLDAFESFEPPAVETWIDRERT